jgi:hypothetical protein
MTIRSARIVAGVALASVVAILVALATRWIGYANGGAQSVCDSDRWMPWTPTYEATGSTPVLPGFSLAPLGLSCTSNASVTYPDAPIASQLIVLAFILLVIAAATVIRPQPTHRLGYALTALLLTGVAAISLLGTAFGGLLYQRNGWWEECGVPPGIAIGDAAIEGIRPVLSGYSIVPSGALCTYASPIGGVTVFDGGLDLGSVMVAAASVAIGCAVLARRARGKQDASGAGQHAQE